MKRTELKRKTPLSQGQATLGHGAPLARSGPPRPKKRPKVTAEVSRAMGEWGQAVARASCCEHCGVERGAPWEGGVVRLEGHHALRRQVIERLALEADLDPGVIAWNRNWLIVLCYDCHAKHTTRFRRLPMRIIPDRAYAMARFLDLALKEVGRPMTATIRLTEEYQEGLSGAPRKEVNRDVY